MQNDQTSGPSGLIASPPTAQDTPRPRLLTRKEAAAYLNISEKTLASWACSGRYRLPVIKIGDRLARYRKSDLDALVDRHQIGP